MKLRFLKGGKIKEILEFTVTFILRRLRETGPRASQVELISHEPAMNIITHHISQKCLPVLAHKGIRNIISKLKVLLC